MRRTRDVEPRLVMEMAHGYRLNEVARLLGVATRTVLRYEERGELGDVPRSSAGHRRFTPENIQRLIRVCQKARQNIGDVDIVVRQTPTDQRLTIGEVSALLHVHPRTLQKLEEQGKIPAVPRDANGNRSYRQIDLARVRRYLMAGKTDVTPPWLKDKRKRKK
jgi:DNA-binding transcriptional MerR regulator